MVIIYIIFFILVIGIILTSFILYSLNCFDNYVIRINEAETNIESALNKRFDLLNKSNEVIKEELSIEEDVLNTITNIRSIKLNNFELDEKLYEVIEEFYNYSEEYIDLKINDDYTKIEIELIESEAEILALKEYYNDIVKKYNEKEQFIIKDHTELINNLKQR